MPRQNILPKVLLVSIFFVASLIVTVRAEARKPVSSNGSTNNASSDEGAEETRESVGAADSGMSLRKIRRVAIGAQAVGDLGFGGALFEVNFTPEWGMIAGFGGGEGIQTYEFGAKYVLGGETFLPYLGLDFSHWSSIGKTGPIDHTNPSIISDHFLTGDERASGSFQKNFLVPAFGVQYVQLSGDWAGISVFAEFDVLMDVGDFLVGATGAGGILYYF